MPRCPRAAQTRAGDRVPAGVRKDQLSPARETGRLGAGGGPWRAWGPMKTAGLRPGHRNVGISFMTCLAARKFQRPITRPNPGFLGLMSGIRGKMARLGSGWVGGRGAWHLSGFAWSTGRMRTGFIAYYSWGLAFFRSTARLLSIGLSAQHRSMNPVRGVAVAAASEQTLRCHRPSLGVSFTLRLPLSRSGPSILWFAFSGTLGGRRVSRSRI